MHINFINYTHSIKFCYFVYLKAFFFSIDSGYVHKPDQEKVSRYNRFQNYAFAVSYNLVL